MRGSFTAGLLPVVRVLAWPSPSPPAQSAIIEPPETAVSRNFLPSFSSRSLSPFEPLSPFKSSCMYCDQNAATSQAVGSSATAHSGGPSSTVGLPEPPPFSFLSPSLSPSLCLQTHARYSLSTPATASSRHPYLGLRLSPNVSPSSLSLRLYGRSAGR